MPQPLVSLHRFETFAKHRGRDGANYAYSEAASLLESDDRLACRIHDFTEVVRDDEVARRCLSDTDVVVSCVGPHAFMYFYLREKLGLDFRIVRDVRTGLWNGYLLQEYLCAPYIRDGDSVVYPSAFARDLFELVYPSTSQASCHVCYPLTQWFPPAGSGNRRDTFRVGYVGRLTSDKGFAAALRLLVDLRRRRPGKYELVAIGEGVGRHGNDAVVRSILGSDLSGYKWVRPVTGPGLWAQYKDLDLVFFPSTSNLETFGRVLLEASHAGIPVVASDHAAASELLPAESLVPTHYATNFRFSVHYGTALGDIDTGPIADALVAGEVPPRATAHLDYANDPKRFVDLVRCGNDSEPVVGRKTGTTIEAAFRRRLQLFDFPPVLEVAAANAAIGHMRSVFTGLHQRRRMSYWRSMAQLLTVSEHRDKTLSFIRRSVLRGEDFTNIGGVDLQLAHLIRYYPSFTIGPSDGH